MPHRLSALRDEIADVDRALLELLHRRMALAAEVGRVKADAGLPIVVANVEERVLSRARQHAEACGVSEEVMADIFEAIIRGSVERQHRVGVAARARRGGRVLLVGGAGGMGTWFGRFFDLVGHRVDIVDTSLGPVPAKAGRWASLDLVPDIDVYDGIVVAVPLAVTPDVVRAVAARRPRGVVVEIASIKAHVAPAIAEARAAGVRVSSLHPMFGPGKSPYEPLTFVLGCTDPAAEEEARLAPLLAHPYTKLITMPFDHHDRLMGWLLGLAHLSGMVFGSALTRAGLKADELHAAASTTFRRQAATAVSILSEDPDLYLDIQRLNPHREAVYDAVRAALADLDAATADADREGFRDLLTDARRMVGD